MAIWTCPSCDRTFGRTRQSHVCVPAITVDEWFAEEAPAHRAIHDAIVEHLEDLGEVRVEAVAVGIFYKRSRTFAELRPRRDHLALSMLLPAGLDHARFSRRMAAGRDRVAYVVPLRGVEDLDDQLWDWLTQSWAESAG